MVIAEMLFPFRILWTLFKWSLYGLIALGVFIGFFFISLPNVSYLRDHTPKTTAFMELYVDKAKSRGEDGVIDIQWVPYSQISSNLKKAVLVSEDDAFFRHKGFDWNQIRASIERNWHDKAFSRGGSTITQQLVKNLYLGPSKNPLRKIREWIITYQMEKTLSKRRIFELYLNLVEWGPGVYGAETASRYYYGKSAGQLGPREAAHLAAILPNPVLYGSKKYSRRINWKTNLILKRMHVPPPTEELKREEKMVKSEVSPQKKLPSVEEMPNGANPPGTSENDADNNPPDDELLYNY